MMIMRMNEAIFGDDHEYDEDNICNVHDDEVEFV